MTPLIQQQQEYREKLSECGPVITEAHYNSDRTCLYETNYEVNLEGGRSRFIVGAVCDRRYLVRKYSSCGAARVRLSLRKRVRLSLRK